MTPYVMKQGMKWNIIAKRFPAKTSTFEQVICSFINTGFLHVYEKVVTGIAKHWTVLHLREKYVRFFSFWNTRQATDVTFCSAVVRPD